MEEDDKPKQGSSEGSSSSTEQSEQPTQRPSLTGFTKSDDTDKNQVRKDRDN